MSERIDLGRHATRSESGRSLGRSSLRRRTRFIVGTRNRCPGITRARTGSASHRLLQASARALAGRCRDTSRASRSLRRGRQAGRAAAIAPTDLGDKAAGEGRPRVRRAHRAAQAPRRRGVRMARRRVPADARAPRAGLPPAHARDLRSRPSSRTASRAASTRWCSSRSPTRPPPQAREYAFAYEADSETVQLPRRAVYRDERPDRRGHRERRRAGRQPGDRDVHARARVLRALSPARTGRRRRAAVPRRGRRRSATRSPTTSARSCTCSGRADRARASTCCITPKSRAVLLQQAATCPGLAQTVEEKGDPRIYDFVAAERRRRSSPSR